MAKSRLVLLPVAGAGHILSMMEMAKLLLGHHPGTTESHFSITILVPGPASAPAVEAYIRSVAASGIGIEFRELPSVEPPVDCDGPEDFVSLLLQSHKPHVKAAVSDLLSSSTSPVAALIVDFFATAMIDVAAELGVPCYIYFTSGAAGLSLMLHLPTLHHTVPMEFEEMEGEVRVPGISPIPPLSMPSPLMSKRSRRYTWFVHHGRRFWEAKGIIVNTFAELEPAPLQAIAEGGCAASHRTPSVFPVGPLLALGDASGADGSKRHECLEWLDGQPSGSVVFLCFGSKGCFDAPQAKEMTVGLERSGHRFLWALRVASSEEAAARAPVDTNLDEVLPEGFVDRSKGRGLVWPSWAPQAAILAHRAVGGFVTHCGWNSCLESVWFGIPMLGWPLYAEQHLNAFVMAKDMGVALELKVDRKRGNFVTAEELERGVRCLMDDCEEGNRVRAKAKEMMLASRKAGERGGSSFIYMERLVMELLKGGEHAMT